MGARLRQAGGLLRRSPPLLLCGKLRRENSDRLTLFFLRFKPPPSPHAHTNRNRYLHPLPPINAAPGTRAHGGGRMCVPSA